MRRSPELQFILIISLAFLSTSAWASDVVVNDAGVPLKLITTRATSLHAEPDRGSASSPAEIFRYWYLLPPEPNMASPRQSDLGSLTRDGFYRVASGLSERDFQGWLAADDVVLWSHRQALRPAERQGRQLVTFYASRDEAIQAVRTGDVSLATHREPASANGLLLMPILDADEVEIDGEPNHVYKVAFVSPGTSSSTPGSAGGLTRTQVRAKTTVDVVFVVDTTSSMARPIDQVRKSIAQVAGDLSRRPDLQRRLRLGLVGYRDTIDGVHPAGMGYLTKVICDLNDGKDHNLFLKRLANMELSQGASEDYPEDVLAGLATAMESQLGWNPYAWKHIVVVGDSSAKAPDHPDPISRRNDEGRTVQSIVKQAAGSTSGTTISSYVISAVRVKDPLFMEDHVIGDRQFNQLIAGPTYSGKMISARGGFRPEDFSAELIAFLNEGLDNFEKAVMLSGGTPAPPSGTTAAVYPYPVLDLLRRLPDESQAPEERFAARFCTERDADGNRVLAPHLFTRRGRLKAFTSFLDFLVGILEDVGNPGSRDVGEILSQLKTMSASLQLDESLSPDMKLDSVLTGILGLPIKTPIFQLSFGDLAAMTEARYQEWVRSVDAVQEGLRIVIDNEKLWFDLHPNAQDRDAHAFVALSDLP